MARISLQAHGDALPAVAWERYADTRRWSSWSPQISRVDLAGDGPRIVAGLRGRVVPIVGPGLPFEVLAVDEHAMTWSWRVEVGPLSLRLAHDVTPYGSGSATGLRVHGVLPLVALYAPAARWAMGNLVRP